ncbi:MAG TPA: methyltransferase domain-containing protein [Pedobacter sp.]|jgi:SAM-dependent methyltransferase
MRGPQSRLKRFIPNVVLKKINKNFIPLPGEVRLGDLDRTSPLSKQFGYDRGGPVDRYYIENFLERHRGLIKGRVLEIGDNEYTLRYGGANVQQSDILHINDRNPKATFIGDLSNAPILPDNTFDCVVLTQTLHLIFNHLQALQTCYRVLKPGGTLLLTVPGISHIDQGEWKDIWLWSYTQSSIKRMLSEMFLKENIETQVHGNVLVATAFLYGMGLPELKKSQMDETDPHYQVIITASAMKS